jgi:hypothetical protein
MKESKVIFVLSLPRYTEGEREGRKGERKKKEGRRTRWDKQRSERKTTDQP